MKARISMVLLAIIILSFTLSSQNNSSAKMEKQVIDKFQVVGIAVRTSNANGQAATDIEALWTRFWTEDIRNKVPNSISEDIYAVYTDYESDYTGAYTMIIGMPVNSLEQIPEGYEGITIEKDNYKKYVSKGKMPEAVVKTWMEIWQEKTLKRAYKADFTVHGKKYFDGDKAEVETFISIKE